MTDESGGAFAITEASVERMARKLAETASHAEFLKMIQGVQAATGSERKSVAERVARVEEVSARGIPIPEDFRLTTRTFEETESSGVMDDPRPGSPTVTFDGQSGSVAYRGLVVTVKQKQSTPEVASAASVKAEIQHGIEAIGEFAASPAFQAALAELAALPEDARPQFVARELLDPAKRAQRGLVLPDGMRLQRSWFADGRPTLFCVSKVLPLAYPWHKVTITFDDA